jgi:hypothetical protein
VVLVGYAAGTQRSITELEAVLVDVGRDCGSCRLRTRREEDQPAYSSWWTARFARTVPEIPFGWTKAGAEDWAKRTISLLGSHARL